MEESPVYECFVMFRGLLILLVCCLIASCARKNNTVVFSSKYIPPYNPGGQRFESDEDLVRSYDMYARRRAIIEQKQKNRVKSDVAANAPSKENIEKKLREYGVVGSGSSEQLSRVGGAGVMVNKDGIDLSLIKGAKTIRVDDSQWGPLPVTPLTKGSLRATPRAKEGLKTKSLDGGKYSKPGFADGPSSGSLHGGGVNKKSSKKNIKPDHRIIFEDRRSDYNITSDDGVESASSSVICKGGKNTSVKEDATDSAYPIPKRKPIKGSL